MTKYFITQIDNRLLLSADGTESHHGTRDVILAGTYEECIAYLENLLVKVWRTVFGMEDITSDDDFFDLGGDSLFALKVASAAEKVGIELYPRDILEFSTITDIVKSIIFERMLKE